MASFASRSSAIRTLPRSKSLRAHHSPGNWRLYSGKTKPRSMRSAFAGRRFPSTYRSLVMSSRTYKPDAVVVVIVHNDFDESYRLAPGRYTPAFLHLVVDGENVKEIPPRPYQEAALETWVRTRSRTFRFLFYRLGLGSQQLRSLYSAATGRPQQFEANVDVQGLAGEEPKMRRVASYVFDQFARLERSSGTRFVIVMDAPREAITRGEIRARRRHTA